MKIIQLHIYLLVCRGAAECFTEKSVNLGEDVTLKCEVSVKNVFWFLMKPSEPPVFILRSYSSKTVDAHYSNTTFRKRFSVQYNSSLFIHNISTKELGVYYCIQTQPASLPGISSGIRLRSADNRESDIKQQKNQTLDKDDKVDKDELSRNILILSGTAAGLVMLSVTVLITSQCGRSNSPKFHLQPPNCAEEQLSGPQKSFTQVQNDVFTVVEFTQFPPEA
ncbi:uncharacterized protein LOC131347564 [Hemibagrus wyckioides]|uniref:uncharacterized protein LOC131347564 n=1 Tax=Hemibagrus wyckioides TaxID=337641 RepID=UPI00266CFC5F|nr:uncharacterized protein LOC131347564 [Hemibagrus wyckioides]